MEDKDILIIQELIESKNGELLNCWDYGEEAKKSLKKLLQAYKQDEKVIEEMAKYMVQEFAEYQLDNIYAELYNCNGLERNWTRGDEEEIKDILKYFRKKCE